MLAIETQNLSRAFKGKPAVSKLNMHVPKGSIYGFIGQNGAGKSTTQKMICGLLHPDEGSIRLYGKSGDDAAIRSKIGVIIESPALFPGATAYENMMMQSLNLGVDAPDGKIKDLLKPVGLSDTGKKKAKFFSLGMKQRLAIGQSLLGDPKLLILDEPTNGLDPQGMQDLWDMSLRVLPDSSYAEGDVPPSKASFWKKLGITVLSPFVALVRFCHKWKGFARIDKMLWVESAKAAIDIL